MNFEASALPKKTRDEPNANWYKCQWLPRRSINLPSLRTPNLELCETYPNALRTLIQPGVDPEASMHLRSGISSTSHKNASMPHARETPRNMEAARESAKGVNNVTERRQSRDTTWGSGLAQDRVGEASSERGLIDMPSFSVCNISHMFWDLFLSLRRVVSCVPAVTCTHQVDLHCTRSFRA